jgi:RimJ/RimL family protein N-acetyltransferase
VIRLEPLGEQHLGLLERLVEDPDVQRFTRLPRPAPPEVGREWLARYEAGRRDGTREGFAIVADGEVVGLAVVPEIDGGTAELGYVVVPEARGRGHATAALAALTDWALARGLRRLELRIDADNHASKRVAERCGYVFERVADVEVWSLAS